MSSVTDVFLIAHPRSGTHAVASMLAANGDIQHIGEVFHIGSGEHRENYFHFLGALQSPFLALPQNAHLRFQTYLGYLHHIWHGQRLLLDMKYDVLHLFDGPLREPHAPPDIFRLLREGGGPVVHLTRNLLHVCFSTLNAVATEQWHVAGGEQPRTRQMTVDTDYVLAFLYQKHFEETHVRRYMDTLSNAIEVDYDAIFGADNLGRQRLFEFLGISDRGLAPNFKKQINKPYSALIENYAEVVAAVKNSPFKTLLPEVEQLEAPVVATEAACNEH
jgi:hypothetical protein